jgi:phosphoadenosine phosphosulfate reductase
MTNLAGHGPGRHRSPAQLQAIAEQAGAELAQASAEEIAAWAAEVFPDSLAVACSMAGDTVVPHLLARFVPGVDVLFLDTGYHFAETLATRAELAVSINATIIDVLPALSLAQQDIAYGPRLHERDASLCCQLRKVEPMNAELATYEAWVTGLRREDNARRAQAQPVEWDATHQLVKINPLVDWSFDDLLAYAGQHDVPINLLLTDGYPSIGCAPCTRRVEPGEDPRAGRWAGLVKTECGLHL